MPRDRKSYNKDLTREKKRVALSAPFNKGFRPLQNGFRDKTVLKKLKPAG